MRARAKLCVKDRQWLERLKSVVGPKLSAKKFVRRDSPTETGQKEGRHFVFVCATLPDSLSCSFLVFGHPSSSCRLSRGPS